MYSLRLFRSGNSVKPSTSEIPKSIHIYFILVLCLFGFDFGIKKTLRKYFRILCSCVQLCMSIMMCFILLLTINFVQVDTYVILIYTIQYLTYSVLLLFSKYNVYDLIIDVYSLDKSIMEAVNIKFAFALYFFTIITCGLKQTLCMVNCFFKTTQYCIKPFPGYFHCLPIIGLDAVTIVQISLCYYVYLCVKNIKIALDNCTINTVRERYRSVVMYCDQIQPLNSALVSVFIFLFNCTICD